MIAPPVCGLDAQTTLLCSVQLPGYYRVVYKWQRSELVPSKYEPEDLFRNRPKVNRVLTINYMDRAIALAADRG